MESVLPWETNLAQRTQNTNGFVLTAGEHKPKGERNLSAFSGKQKVPHAPLFSYYMGRVWR